MKAAERALRRFALSDPGAHEDFPWGERVIKVKNKSFVFLGPPSDFSVTVKLPHSGLVALSLPFVSPTSYGLGRSGWVTARLSEGRKPPLHTLRAWID
jgi:hypothetical protein